MCQEIRTAPRSPEQQIELFTDVLSLEVAARSGETTAAGGGRRSSGAP